MTDTTILPDGSAFFTGSFPLPADHWLTAPQAEGWDEDRDTTPDTPLPFLNHEDHLERVVTAMRYAIRAATMRGQESDFDPDALVQSAVFAMCGPYGGVSVATA